MESAIADAELRATKSPGVLIIEGDALMRSLLKEWLTGVGYTVRLELPRHGASSLGVDVVIVDLYMPRQAGARIIRAVQRAHPDTPIIAISGQFRPGLAGSSPTARALGATRLLAKPFSREDLLVAVRAVVGPPR